ncbi:MAG TPA: PIN domain-containing protein [Gemmataceae bacterium]|nr:PIN domain-containing protein [Gemmataceae bacterium]
MSSQSLRPLLDRLSRYFAKRPPSGHLLLWLLRGIFGVICIGIAMLAFRHFSEGPGDTANGYLAFLCILGAGMLIVVSDVLIRNKQITTLSAVYFGLLLGLLLGNILSTALEPFLFDWGVQRPSGGVAPHLLVDKDGVIRVDVTQGGGGTAQELRIQYERKALSLIITVICCYLAISTLLQTKDEFRFIIPYVEFSKQVKGAKPLVLDTSVIIDGRIADVCDTRFIDTKLIVPRFVLQELQSVADSSDKLKRNRGRRGLDMLKRMQNNPKVELQMHEANLPVLRDVHKVDERLVVLAKALDARVVTNDYNLNKIAQLQGVEVINLNELANSLKSVALPGELMTVRIVKAGDQIGQGVGYLEDGTMVVIEHGRSMIGQEVSITVTSVLQTPAGRMIFGRLEGRPVVATAGNQ